MLDASLALLTEGGIEAVSFRAVARKLGVSHAAPGHHFRDKRALLAAVAERGFAQLADEMEARRDAFVSAADRLNATGVAYVRFAAANPSLFRLMFTGEPKPDDVPGAGQTRAFDVLVGAAADAAGESADAERVRLVTTAAWSLVHGLALLWLDGRLGAGCGIGADADVEQLARRVTELVSRAL